MARTIWQCLALASAAYWGASVGAVETDTSVSALRKYLASLNSFSAKFEQKVFDETGASLETSTGEVSIARPGKFAWLYRAPYHQSIISNSHTLWLYDVDLAQVTVSAIDATAAGSAAQLLGDKVDLNEHYILTSQGERAGIQWVGLKPKKAEQQYQRIEIGMAGATLAKMRLFDNLGQVTELSFTAIQRNPTLDPELFEFTPPPDVDVISGLKTQPN